MKITDSLKSDAIYIQKKDVLYLRDMFSLEFVTDELLNEKKIKDFILVEGEDNVKLISSRDEILEFKDFLSFSKKEIEQRMYDAEQLLYIVSKSKTNSMEIAKYRYAHDSAVLEFLEKERGSLSFEVPLSIDMLNNYLFYDSDGTYYASSTTLKNTYQIGRIDGEKIDTRNNQLEKFVKVEMMTASDLTKDYITDKITTTKTKSADCKKLYYTLNRKK